MVVIALALICVLVVGGSDLYYYNKVQTEQRAAAAAAAAAAARAMARARTQASDVLTKVEECESAVTVGVSLEDLSEKASTAREAALAFSRSEDAKLLPDFTLDVLKAAQDYTDSCAAWFESNEAAQKKWEKAFDKWNALSSKPSPKLADFKDDSKYQALWVQAQEDLAKARADLKETAQ